MKGLALLLVGGLIAALVAIRADDYARREVAGHDFEIPPEYLFNATIPWLPNSEEDSFVFLLEPNARPTQIPEHRVLVESLSRFCISDTSQQMLRIACGREDAAIDDEPPYVEVPDEHVSFSSHVFALRGAQRRQVAFCRAFGSNPESPEGGKTCTTFWAHGDLMLLLDFDISELPELRSMKQDATRLLDSWKIS